MSIEPWELQPATRPWSRCARGGRCFGRIAENVAVGLAVRHDRGNQYLSDAFQMELAFLGIESSPAFIRAPEGNGCAERVIRTLNEQPLWVKTFRTFEEDLRVVLISWADLYNREWLIERHGFRPPAEAPTGVLRSPRETRGLTRRANINHLSRKALTATTE